MPGILKTALAILNMHVTLLVNPVSLPSFDKCHLKCGPNSLKSDGLAQSQVVHAFKGLHGRGTALHNKK
eukprot:77460-Amphidinium_carterae.2